MPGNDVPNVNSLLDDVMRQMAKEASVRRRRRASILSLAASLMVSLLIGAYIASVKGSDFFGGKDFQDTFAHLANIILPLFGTVVGYYFGSVKSSEDTYLNYENIEKQFAAYLKMQELLTFEQMRREEDERLTRSRN